jgi:hypothetical protein
MSDDMRARVDAVIAAMIADNRLSLRAGHLVAAEACEAGDGEEFTAESAESAEKGGKV